LSRIAKFVLGCLGGKLEDPAAVRRLHARPQTLQAQGAWGMKDRHALGATIVIVIMLVQQGTAWQLV
jgi:hypothetical protein